MSIHWRTQSKGEATQLTLPVACPSHSNSEWMGKARDESNTITISGRFDSLGDAVRDARTQIDGLAPDDDPAGDDLFVA